MEFFCPRVANECRFNDSQGNIRCQSFLRTLTAYNLLYTTIIAPICFSGGSSWVGKGHPRSAGSLPRVSASPEEEAGGCVLVEEPEDEAKVEDMYEERRWGERRTGCRVIAIPLPFLQVLEGDEVSYACEGQEGGVPWENCPAELVMVLLHVFVNCWTRGKLVSDANVYRGEFPITQKIHTHCFVNISCESRCQSQGYSMDAFLHICPLTINSSVSSSTSMTASGS